MILTLLVNAITIRKLVQYLGLDKVKLSKELLFKSAMKEVELAGKEEEQHLKTDALYACASWPDVRRYKFKVPKVNVKYFSRNDGDEVVDRDEQMEVRRRLVG